MDRFKIRLSKQQKSTRLLQRQQQQQQFFEQLKSKPFWIWDKHKHKRQYVLSSGKCCFNHVIGLPQKNGKQMPLFDYQKI